MRAFYALCCTFPLWLSCHGGGATPLGEGLDETLDCPEGFIGWNYRTHPPRTLSTQFPDNAASLRARWAIDIGEVRCDGTGASTAARQQANVLRRECNGRQECDLTVDGACRGAVSVSYQCGLDDVDPANANQLRTRSATLAAEATSRSLALRCQPPAPPAEVLPERSACVPRYCHGQSRRDDQLNCMPDSTMPVVQGVTVTPAPLRPTRKATHRSYPDAEFYMGATYDLSVDVTYPGTRSDVPEEARLTVWLGDLFRSPNQLNATPDSDGVDVAFRCTWLKLDVSRQNIVSEGDSTVTVRATAESRFPSNCWDPRDEFGARPESGPAFHPRVERDFIRRTGLVRNAAGRYSASASDSFGAAGEREHGATFVFYSFDIEGQTTFIQEGETMETVCAPNPPSFYWSVDRDSAGRPVMDASGTLSGDFDMADYYKQRLVARSTSGRFAYEYPRFLYVGPTGLRLGTGDMSSSTGAAPTPGVEVTALPARNPTVPMDIGWYVENDSRGQRNPFSFEGSSGGPNLKANIYIYPSDRITERNPLFPLVASYDLGAAPPDGTVMTVDVPLNDRVRSAMYNPDSALFVDPETHGNTRSFEVAYCIESADGTLSTRGWSGGRTAPQMRAGGGVDATSDWVLELRWKELPPATSPIYNFTNTAPAPGLEDGDAFRQVRGCVFSDTPLIVTVDRLVRGENPVGNGAYPGNEANRRSGSAKMSGSSDTDSEIVCMDADGENCSEALQGQMMGSGNLGRTYYAYDTELQRNTTSATGSGSASMTGEVLGFMAIDPTDQNQSATSTAGSSTPITFSVVPPWDEIRSALATTLNSPPGSVLRTEWKTGRYAGIMGLGLGIGFKQQFQIGPIPGAIVITFSAGVALEASFSMQFAPLDREAYPCASPSYSASTGNCVQAQAGVASLADAASDCYLRGGRLAELGTAGEATAFREAAVASDASLRYWSGAQAAYGHRRTSCLDPSTYAADRCAAQLRTSYRWLSSDVQLANSIGSVDATYSPGHVTASTLRSIGPQRGGLLYDPRSGQLQVERADAAHPYVCSFDWANSARFLKWSVAMKLGTGGGVALALCVPTDDPGICIEGSLSFISLSITPTLSQTSHWLRRGSRGYGSRTNMSFRIPWSLTILEGQVAARIQAWIFSVSWPIVTFDGFTLTEGTLLDLNFPSHRNY